MVSYVAMLVIGVGVGIWHYRRRYVPKRYRKLCPALGISGNDFEGGGDDSGVRGD
jgi:hypothetical protein